MNKNYCKFFNLHSASGKIYGNLQDLQPLYPEGRARQDLARREGVTHCVIKVQKKDKILMNQEIPFMARKIAGQKAGAKEANSARPEDIFRQMEDLQRELVVLAKRAEDEMEAILLNHPEPVIRMLQAFCSRVHATQAMVSFDSVGNSFVTLDGIQKIDLLEGDLLQCRMALSGREMAMDFTQGRVYLPVVVFENPIAVAVFKVPSLRSGSYDSVCNAARDCICELRNELKIPCGSRVVNKAAS